MPTAFDSIDTATTEPKTAFHVEMGPKTAFHSPAKNAFDSALGSVSAFDFDAPSKTPSMPLGQAPAADFSTPDARFALSGNPDVTASANPVTAVYRGALKGLGKFANVAARNSTWLKDAGLLPEHTPQEMADFEKGVDEKYPVRQNFITSNLEGAGEFGAPAIVGGALGPEGAAISMGSVSAETERQRIHGERQAGQVVTPEDEARRIRQSGEIGILTGEAGGMVSKAAGGLAKPLARIGTGVAGNFAVGAGGQAAQNLVSGRPVGENVVGAGLGLGAFGLAHGVGNEMGKTGLSHEVPDGSVVVGRGKVGGQNVHIIHAPDGQVHYVQATEAPAQSLSDAVQNPDLSASGGRQQETRTTPRQGGQSSLADSGQPKAAEPPQPSDESRLPSTVGKPPAIETPARQRQPNQQGSVQPSEPDIIPIPPHRGSAEKTGVIDLDQPLKENLTPPVALKGNEGNLSKPSPLTDEQMAGKANPAPGSAEAATTAERAETPKTKPAEPMTQGPSEPTKADTVAVAHGEDPRIFSGKHEDIDLAAKILGIDGLPSRERVGRQQSIDDAIKHGIPDKAVDIAAEIVAKPRPLTLEEEQGLKVRQVRMSKQYDKLTAEMNAAKDPAEKMAKAAERRRIEQDDEIILSGLKLGISEAGATLRSSQDALGTNETLLATKTRAKEAKGSPLTAAEDVKIEAVHKDLQATKAKLAEVESRLNERIANEALRETRGKARIKNKEVELQTSYAKLKELLKQGCAGE